MADVEPDSPSWRAGLRPGDLVRSINGVTPRDIIEWHRLVASPSFDMVIERGPDTSVLRIESFGEPLGMSVSSALFDRVQTCDNHCEFCFIYQLPKGMRRSLYLKDDDYRLSFLYGNFTTLTRFTEADLERVIEENLSPLYVSVHAIDPHKRSEMLKNDRGGVSLRWLSLLLEHGITVRAQIVLCPGVNDSAVLDSTMAGLLERFPTLESIAIVPLGLSRFNKEARMRVHSPDEARRVIAQIESWKGRFSDILGRQSVHLADEFYLLGNTPIPDRATYGDFTMLEDGVGLVRSFIDSFHGVGPNIDGRADGFFSAFDAPNPTAYMSVRNPACETSLRPSETRVALRTRSNLKHSRLVVLSGEYGARVIGPLVEEAGFGEVEVRAVTNKFFGGNTAVAGLLTFDDIKSSISADESDALFILPDVCLNDGRFLDGPTIEDLRKIVDVEVIPTDGRSLRDRLSRFQYEAT